MSPACRAFWSRIACIPLSTTAAISAIQCRCGKQVCSSPFREKVRDKQAGRTSENAIRKGTDLTPERVQHCLADVLSALSEVYVLRYLLDPLLFAGKQAFYPWSSRWHFLDALIIRCFSKHDLLDI